VNKDNNLVCIANQKIKKRSKLFWILASPRQTCNLIDPPLPGFLSYSKNNPLQHRLFDRFNFDFMHNGPKLLYGYDSSMSGV